MDVAHSQCRLSLRERTPFRGAKGDTLHRFTANLPFLAQDAFHRVDPGGWSFKHGQARSCSPPACMKVSRASLPISSNVSRQSAVKPGIATKTCFSPALASRVSVSSVYGFSHRSRPNSDWNDCVHSVRCQPSRSINAEGRSLDVRRIRVAALRIRDRDAVKAKHVMVRRPRQLREVVANDCRMASR